MASFSQGLAQGLSGLPQALMYRQERKRKDAYRKDISGLSSVGNDFDYGAAARVALKHGDITSAFEYRRMGAEANARSAAGDRQSGLDDIAAEERARRIAAEDSASAAAGVDRTRKIAAEDRASGIAKREGFARRLAPLLQAGDADAMGRLVASHPGLLSETQNFGPGRRVVGVEKITTPEGEVRYALQIRNARTGTIGPEQTGGSTDPEASVKSYTADQLMRNLQPFLPADKGTTEQQNIAAFLERNPGASEAEYFEQKRSPGVTVNTGDQGGPKAPAISHPVYGPPSKNHVYEIDPATGTHVLNDAGLPKEIPRPGSPADPATKTDEAAVKVRFAAEGGTASLDILEQKNDRGKTAFEEMSDLGQHLASKVPLFGNYMLTPEYQKATQAVMNFIEGQLRLASGAAVPDVEVERYRELYTPRPGDSAQVIEQKMGMLQQKVNTARDLSGQSPLEAEETAPQAPEPAIQPPGAPAAPQPQPSSPGTLIGSAQASTLAEAEQPSVGEGTFDPEETRRRVDIIPRMKKDEFNAFVERVSGNLEGYALEVKQALAAEWDRRSKAK